MCHVEGGGQGGLFAGLVRAEDLRDFDDLSAPGFEILDGCGAIAGAEVDAEAESRFHLNSTSAGAMPGSLSPVLMMRGSLTNSVFQPLWMSVPVNGGSPLIFPTRRYSSGA